MTIEATFLCAYCLQVVETIVDASGGPVQEYIEDCAVCCRPNLLRITVDVEGESASIEAEYP
jgi:hypothetical protein